MDILLTALLAVLALCLTVVAAIAETAFTYLPHNEAEEAVEAHPDTLGARVLQRTLDGDSEAYTHPLRLTRLIAAATAVLATMTCLLNLVEVHALAAVLTTLAIGSRIGADLLETLTSMFNPLPAIALLPLALIWFGLGTGSIIFVLVHSVLWAIALNTHAGFRSVSNTLRMVGLNYGLRGLKLVRLILIPAAFPAILTGLKVGWAFAWRTLIAAELVFGVSSGAGGLGWFIYENRNQLETANVFAGLFTVILIGLFVENVIFATIERKTIRRWGMQH